MINGGLFFMKQYENDPIRRKRLNGLCKYSLAELS